MYLLSDNENITKYVETKETENYYYIFMEYCNDGDLKEYMRKLNISKFSENETKQFLI